MGGNLATKRTAGQLAAVSGGEGLIYQEMPAKGFGSRGQQDAKKKKLKAKAKALHPLFKERYIK